MMKTIYRRGLGHRYGRVMQVISGVHYNYSFPNEFWPVFQTNEKNSDELQQFISDSYGNVWECSVPPRAIRPENITTLDIPTESKKRNAPSIIGD